MTSDQTPDPIAILLAEHEAGYRLFDALDAALSDVRPEDGTSVQQTLAVTRGMIAYLHHDLEVHIRKEEEPLFPLVKAALPADDRLIDEMVAEHDQIRLKGDAFREALHHVLSPDDHTAVREQRAALAEAFDRVRTGAPDAASLAALRRAWRTLGETMRVHFQNEEEIVFPLARKLLSAEALTGAGRAMQAIASETAEPVASTLLPDPRQDVADLLASPEAMRTGRTARTLLKQGPLRLVLVVLHPEARLQEHSAAGPVTIQALSGHVTVNAGGGSHDLRAGDLLALPAGLTHSVHAHDASGILLTMTVPG